MRLVSILIRPSLRSRLVAELRTSSSSFFLRLFPPVIAIPKTAGKSSLSELLILSSFTDSIIFSLPLFNRSDEDTTLVYQSTTRDAEGNFPNETLFVHKGTDVLIDTPSLHTNRE